MSDGYEGRTTVVTGAASGMGLACAELLEAAGAIVHRVDARAVAAPRSTVVDLRDPVAISAYAEAFDGPVDLLFNCAGLPHGPRFDPLDVVTVNFVGLRHLTEALVPRIAEGGAIVSISSIAGSDWRAYAEPLAELMGTEGFEDGRAWCEGRPDLVSPATCYAFSKRAVTYYTLFRADALKQRGIRINATSPGPTETSMLPAFAETVASPDYFANLEARMGRHSSAEEQARVLLFLAGPAASCITGSDVVADLGLTAMLETGQLRREDLL